MAGETYTQSTGIKDSYVDAVRLRNENEMKLQMMLSESKVTQKNSYWYNDDVAAIASNNALIEGAAASAGTPDDLDDFYNWTQIIGKDYKISGTQAATKYKGLDSYVAYQKAKAVKIVLAGLEYALLVSTGNAGTSDTARQLRGIPYWVTAVNTDCTQTLDSTNFNTSDAGEADINDVLQALKEKGQSPNLMICANVMKRKISVMTAMGATRNSNTEVKSLTVTITVYESDFGDITIMAHNNCEDDTIFIGDRKTLRIGYLRKMQKKTLGIVGDSVAFQILLEATLENLEPTSWGGIVLT